MCVEVIVSQLMVDQSDPALTVSTTTTTTIHFLIVCVRETKMSKEEIFNQAIEWYFLILSIRITEFYQIHSHSQTYEQGMLQELRFAIRGNVFGGRGRRGGECMCGVSRINVELEGGGWFG